jgi:FkbM family methyltransferase
MMSSFKYTPLSFAYIRMGILKFENHDVSGELFVLKRVLPRLLSGKPYPVLFDVGANKGSYTELLIANYPDSRIYSFEPNVNSFKHLKERLQDSKVEIFNIGFGEESCTTHLFSYGNDVASAHASIYSGVLTEIHKEENIERMEIKIETIDDFCRNNKIDGIDFLKIDTEGNEYKALLGAKKMLSNDVITVIQFEFNEMNVISRVFFKDFYDFLCPKYNIYRLNSNYLIPIKKYDSSLEIFKYQNVLAIQKSKDCEDF